jgi:DNA-binding NtrC family response regulator
MSKKVLIVEDEFVVANNLRQVLQGFGYEVSGIAASGAEVQESMQKDKPDMVLLDIRLQGESTGIDIARKLKAEGIAFVYLSANSSQKILEEAKTTEPYGFLVKPFRKKDLQVMLDIAWYRHVNSLETRTEQKDRLHLRLTEITSQQSDSRQKLLDIARSLQPNIPFDMISSGLRPVDPGQFGDIGFLRIGFDDYQFIGEKELLTIANLKRSELALILANTRTGTDPIISHGEPTGDNFITPPLEKTLTKTFKMQSWLVYPVVFGNGRQFQYFFYSRQRETYNNNHIILLNGLRQHLAALAECITYGESQVGPKLGHGDPLKTQRKEGRHPEFGNIIGNHHSLLEALDLSAQVAPFNTSVLILGESGTGKENLASAIHLLSPRKTAPYIKIDCGAIPATLMESELFGHEKGAFTGATEKRKGRIEQADGGTIFLDEIGELPMDMQVKILRFLQEKEIKYLGGSEMIKVNVRIIAATNRNLEKEVAAGNFRLDLYYRLNVFPVTLPPLRERSSDIEAVATFFAEKFCREFGKPFTGISSSMLEEMMAYHWPGNIRELENVVEQSVVLNNGRSKLELRRRLPSNTNEAPAKQNINSLEEVKQIQRETEKEYILSILKKAGGRVRGVNGAAELMNMKPSTLESKMARLNIRREDIQ